ncbi:MAG: ribokinase [Spirochaetales bacterium]|nr:ribokinase [Spirochaetales bacterium]
MSGDHERVLVVGSVNMDLVMQVLRVPGPGETLLGSRYSYVPGGKGANQAVAAARLGFPVSFVGRVGADTHGQVLKENLQREGMDAGLLLIDSEEQTGFAAITVEEDGQNRISVFPGANMALRPEDVQKAFRKSYGAVMINLEIPEEIVFEVCRQAGAHGIPVVLDAGPIRDVDFHALEGLEIISPNESEALAITGIPCTSLESAERAARRLVEITPSRYAVLKLGERGALLFDPSTGRADLFPGVTVKPVDTTAAGDAFTAALGVHYLRHGDIAAAVPFANTVAALSVTRLGAQPSMPTLQEVRSFAAERGLEVAI